ncbi:MAG: efflux RND transporter periplasmic adaptor subunit [Paucibacter sp.]|nr:efflux RND transporter periplasmic adaptor subunit [Roseateles sp.]
MTEPARQGDSSQDPTHPAIAEPRSRKRRGPALVLGGSALIAALWAIGRFTDPPKTAHAKTSQGAPVRVGTVSRRDMALIERSAGTVMAETFVQVTPLVTGELKRQFFREGQFVKCGELLFEIDPAPYQAAVDQARSTYLKDVALLKNAQLDQRRFESLYSKDATSQQSRDTAVASTNVLAATAESDKAALDAALLNLGYTKIRSPIDGKTGAVLIQPGNVVSASNTTTLVTIAQVEPVKVSFSLPQGDLPQIQASQQGTRLIARLDDAPTLGSNASSAPIDFVGNGVNAQSGTIELRATFKNTDHRLVPGQLVPVVVELGRLPGALVLPRNAVNDSPAGPYVYVVQQGKAVQKPVTVRFDDGTDVAVTGELNPGDVVVTEGQLRVEAGGAVQVLGPSTPPPRMASDKIHPAAK